MTTSGLQNDQDELKRYIAKNALYHLARITSFIWRRTDNWADVEQLQSQLNELKNNPNILDSFIDESFQKVIGLIDEVPTLRVDINSTLKSSAFDNMINRLVYQEYGTEQSV